jgi:hypothetical protein
MAPKLRHLHCLLAFLYPLLRHYPFSRRGPRERKREWFIR